jgi:GT2 family glycosyltransferase
LLAGALKSILADPGSDGFEIFVVDNNSGDGSVDMLHRDFPSVITRANTENVGFARACNQVIPEATGDCVLLLNPDTVAVDKAISKMADYLESHPDCGAIGPKILNPDGSLQLACRRTFPTPEAAFWRLTYLSFLFPQHPRFARYNLTHADPDTELDLDALSGSCMMLSRHVIERIGLLDEDIFMYGEDIDWCWRVREAGWRVHYLPSAVVYHYHGASSRFRRVGATINLHKGMEVFYRKHHAGKYWPVFNWLVYAAIWLRASAFIILASLQNLLPVRQAVLAGEPVNVPEQAATAAEMRLPVTAGLTENRQP